MPRRQSEHIAGAICRKCGALQRHIAISRNAMYSMVDPYLQAGRTVEWKQLIDNALFKIRSVSTTSIRRPRGCPDVLPGQVGDFGLVGGPVQATERLLHRGGRLFLPGLFGYTGFLSTFALRNPDTQQLRAKAIRGETVPSWLGFRYHSLSYCCVRMSENNYQLVAWTENGEVKFSGVALWEQEMLLWDEYYSLYYSEDKGWERYSRLVHIAWQWGMLLL